MDYLLNMHGYLSVLPFLLPNVELSCRKGLTGKLCYPEKHGRKIRRLIVALALPVCLSDWLSVFYLIFYALKIIAQFIKIILKTFTLCMICLCCYKATKFRKLVKTD